MSNDKQQRRVGATAKEPGAPPRQSKQRRKEETDRELAKRAITPLEPEPEPEQETVLTDRQGQSGGNDEQAADWQVGLREAVGNGDIVLSSGSPAPDPSAPTSTPGPTPVPTTTATEKRPTVSQSSPRFVDRRPSWRIYGDYFWECAEARRFNDRLGFQFFGLERALRGEVQGRYALPLGFIPGPLVVLGFRSTEGVVQFQIVSATPEVVAEMELQLPTPWQPVRDMPNWLGQAIGLRLALIEGIGGEPTPWHLGLVDGFRTGQKQVRYLRLGFSGFDYAGQQVPFGVYLVATETGEMKVVKVFNPGKLPGVPAEGTILSSEFLAGQGVVQKLLNTCTLMERNARHYGEHHNEPYPVVRR